MRREFAGAVVFIVALAFAISGCAKSIMGPEATIDKQDLSELQQLIKEDPQFSGNTETLNDGEPVQFGVQSGNTIAVKIYPRAWGRRIISTTRDVQYETVNDSTVIATITNTIKGDVIIIAKSSPQDTVIKKITKPFTEVTTHKLKFYHLVRADSTKRHWRPSEISAVKGGTEGSLVTINKVEVTVGTNSYTITDPTNYFMKVKYGFGRLLPILTPNQPIKVHVTLTSSDPDTDWVSLHRPPMISMDMMRGFTPIKPLHIKMTLVSQTQVGAAYERVYEYSWSNHGFGGRHTVFVDALTKGSLYDDTAPFSTQLWGIPYIVQ